jgi:hypothetical protein
LPREPLRCASSRSPLSEERIEATRNRTMNEHDQEEVPSEFGRPSTYLCFSSRNSVKCTVKAGVLTSELGNLNSAIHLGLCPQ